MSLSDDQFSELYELEAEGLLRWLMRRSFDAQVAVDLLAESFALAYESRDRFRSESAPKAWIYGIAGNLIADWFRRGSAEQRAVERLGIAVPTIDDEEIQRIEDLAQTQALRAAVAEALTDLSPQQRTAIDLRVVGELSYEEVAREMQVSQEVARANVSRGLRRLRGIVESRETTEVNNNA